MTAITTVSGFETVVDESRLDDMELLDLVSETMDGNILVYSKIADKLIGSEARKELYEHLRNEAGLVPIQAFINDVTSIMKQLNTKKK